MNQLNFRKKFKVIFRLLVSFIVGSMLTADAARAQRVIGTPLASIEKQSLSAPLNGLDYLQALKISNHIGSVKEVFLTENAEKPVILQIQDSHANFEAQNNILQILDQVLNSQVNPVKGKVLIAVEAASGELSPKKVFGYPEPGVQLKLSEYLMHKGYLSGVESYLLNSDQAYSVYGIEDRGLYRQNLEVFQKTHRKKEAFLKAIQNVKNQLRQVQKEIYPASLIELNRQYYDYKNGSLSFKDFLNRLIPFAVEGGISLREIGLNYSELIQTQNLLLKENGLSFEKVEKQRRLLLSDLKERLVQEEMAELLQKSLYYRLGKISALDYYLYLDQVVEEQYLAPEAVREKYDALFLYIESLQLHAEIDGEVVYLQTEELTHELQGKWLASLSQVECDQLEQKIELLEKLVHLEMSREDLNLFKSFKKELTLSSIAGSLEMIEEDYPHAVRALASLKQAILESETLFSSIGQLEHFYTLALKRDEAMSENLLRKIKSEKASVVILIAGGFHTRGLKEHFSREDISYAVISPRMTQHDTGSYIARMLNLKTPFEKALLRSGNRLGVELLSVNNPMISSTADTRRLVETLVPLIGVALQAKQDEGNLNILDLSAALEKAADEAQVKLQIIRFKVDALNGILSGLVSVNGDPYTVAFSTKKELSAALSQLAAQGMSLPLPQQKTTLVIVPGDHLETLAREKGERSLFARRARARRSTEPEPVLTSGAAKYKEAEAGADLSSRTPLSEEELEIYKAARKSLLVSLKKRLPSERYEETQALLNNEELTVSSIEPDIIGSAAVTLPEEVVFENVYLVRFNKSWRRIRNGQIAFLRVILAGEVPHLKEGEERNDPGVILQEELEAAVLQFEEYLSLTGKQRSDITEKYLPKLQSDKRTKNKLKETNFEAFVEAADELIEEIEDLDQNAETFAGERERLIKTRAGQFVNDHFPQLVDQVLKAGEEPEVKEEPESVEEPEPVAEPKAKEEPAKEETPSPAEPAKAKTKKWVVDETMLKLERMNLQVPNDDKVKFLYALLALVNQLETLFTEYDQSALTTEASLKLADITHYIEDQKRLLNTRIGQYVGERSQEDVLGMVQTLVDAVSDVKPDEETPVAGLFFQAFRFAYQQELISRQSTQLLQLAIYFIEQLVSLSKEISPLLPDQSFESRGLEITGYLRWQEKIIREQWNSLIGLKDEENIPSASEETPEEPEQAPAQPAEIPEVEQKESGETDLVSFILKTPLQNGAQYVQFMQAIERFAAMTENPFITDEMSGFGPEKRAARAVAEATYERVRFAYLSRLPDLEQAQSDNPIASQTIAGLRRSLILTSRETQKTTSRFQSLKQELQKSLYIALTKQNPSAELVNDDVFAVGKADYFMVLGVFEGKARLFHYNATKKLKEYFVHDFTRDGSLLIGKSEQNHVALTGDNINDFQAQVEIEEDTLTLSNIEFSGHVFLFENQADLLAVNWDDIEVAQAKAEKEAEKLPDLQDWQEQVKTDEADEIMNTPLTSNQAIVRFLQRIRVFVESETNPYGSEEVYERVRMAFWSRMSELEAAAENDQGMKELLNGLRKKLNGTARDAQYIAWLKPVIRGEVPGIKANADRPIFFLEKGDIFQVDETNYFLVLSLYDEQARILWLNKETRKITTVFHRFHNTSELTIGANELNTIRIQGEGIQDFILQGVWDEGRLRLMPRSFPSSLAVYYRKQPVQPQPPVYQATEEEVKIFEQIIRIFWNKDEPVKEVVFAFSYELSDPVGTLHFYSEQMPTLTPEENRVFGQVHVSIDADGSYEILSMNDPFADFLPKKGKLIEVPTAWGPAPAPDMSDSKLFLNFNFNAQSVPAESSPEDLQANATVQGMIKTDLAGEGYLGKFSENTHKMAPGETIQINPDTDFIQIGNTVMRLMRDPQGFRSVLYKDDGDVVGASLPWGYGSSFLIGRQNVAELKYESMVSRFHIGIEIDITGNVFVQDLYSTNGTFIRRLQDQPEPSLDFAGTYIDVPVAPQTAAEKIRELEEKLALEQDISVFQGYLQEGRQLLERLNQHPAASGLNKHRLEALLETARPAYTIVEVRHKKKHAVEISPEEDLKEGSLKSLVSFWMGIAEFREGVRQDIAKERKVSPDQIENIHIIRHLRMLESSFRQLSDIFPMGNGRYMLAHKRSFGDTILGDAATETDYKIYLDWTETEGFSRKPVEITTDLLTELRAYLQNKGIQLRFNNGWEDFNDEEDAGIPSKLSQRTKRIFLMTLALYHKYLDRYLSLPQIQPYLKQLKFLCTREGGQGKPGLSSYNDGQVNIYQVLPDAGRKGFAIVFLHEHGHALEHALQEGAFGYETLKELQEAHAILSEHWAFYGMDYFMGASQRIGYQGSFNEFIAETFAAYMGQRQLLTRHVTEFVARLAQKNQADALKVNVAWDKVQDFFESILPEKTPLPLIQKEEPAPAPSEENIIDAESLIWTPTQANLPHQDKIGTLNNEWLRLPEQALRIDPAKHVIQLGHAYIRFDYVDSSTVNVAILNNSGSVLSQTHSVGATLLVGRNPASANLVIHDPTISRLHLKIQFDGENQTVILKDLGSSSGTYVRKIEEKAPEITPVPKFVEPVSVPSPASAEGAEAEIDEPVFALEDDEEDEEESGEVTPLGEPAAPQVQEEAPAPAEPVTSEPETEEEPAMIVDEEASPAQAQPLEDALGVDFGDHDQRPKEPPFKAVDFSEYLEEEEDKIQKVLEAELEESEADLSAVTLFDFAGLEETDVIDSEVEAEESAEEPEKEQEEEDFLAEFEEAKAMFDGMLASIEEEKPVEPSEEIKKLIGTRVNDLVLVSPEDSSGGVLSTISLQHMLFSLYKNRHVFKDLDESLINYYEGLPEEQIVLKAMLFINQDWVEESYQYNEPGIFFDAFQKIGEIKEADFLLISLMDAKAVKINEFVQSLKEQAQSPKEFQLYQEYIVSFLVQPAVFKDFMKRKTEEFAQIALTGYGLSDDRQLFQNYVGSNPMPKIPAELDDGFHISFYGEYDIKNELIDTPEKQVLLFKGIVLRALNQILSALDATSKIADSKKEVFVGALSKMKSYAEKDPSLDVLLEMMAKLKKWGETFVSKKVLESFTLALVEHIVLNDKSGSVEKATARANAILEYFPLAIALFQDEPLEESSLAESAIPIVLLSESGESQLEEEADSEQMPEPAEEESGDLSEIVEHEVDEQGEHTVTVKYDGEDEVTLIVDEESMDTDNPENLILDLGPEPAPETEGKIDPAVTLTGDEINIGNIDAYQQDPGYEKETPEPQQPLEDALGVDFGDHDQRPAPEEPIWFHGLFGKDLRSSLPWLIAGIITLLGLVAVVGVVVSSRSGSDDQNVPAPTTPDTDSKKPDEKTVGDRTGTGETTAPDSAPTTTETPTVTPERTETPDQPSSEDKLAKIADRVLFELDPVIARQEALFTVAVATNFESFIPMYRSIKEDPVRAFLDFKNVIETRDNSSPAQVLQSETEIILFKNILNKYLLNRRVAAQKYARKHGRESAREFMPFIKVLNNIAEIEELLADMVKLSSSLPELKIESAPQAGDQNARDLAGYLQNIAAYLKSFGSDNEKNDYAAIFYRAYFWAFKKGSVAAPELSQTQKELLYERTAALMSPLANQMERYAQMDATQKAEFIEDLKYVLRHLELLIRLDRANPFLDEQGRALLNRFAQSLKRIEDDHDRQSGRDSGQKNEGIGQEGDPAESVYVFGGDGPNPLKMVLKAIMTLYVAESKKEELWEMLTPALERLPSEGDLASRRNDTNLKRLMGGELYQLTLGALTYEELAKMSDYFFFNKDAAFSVDLVLAEDEMEWQRFLKYKQKVDEEMKSALARFDQAKQMIVKLDQNLATVEQVALIKENVSSMTFTGQLEDHSVESKMTGVQLRLSVGAQGTFDMSLKVEALLRQVKEKALSAPGLQPASSSLLDQLDQPASAKAADIAA